MSFLAVKVNKDMESTCEDVMELAEGIVEVLQHRSSKSTTKITSSAPTRTHQSSAPDICRVPVESRSWASQQGRWFGVQPGF